MFEYLTIKNKHIQNKLLFMSILALMLFFYSCEQVYTPKPRAYFRIEFPKKNFQEYQSSCPYTFDYPVYAKVVNQGLPASEKCWINIDYPLFDARLHISYKPIIQNNLDRYIEDSRTLTYKHIVKASDIKEDIVIDDSSKVYGLIYEVSGNAASNMQFYLTDSTRHFLRGSLYFNSAPNYDSIKPVFEFIKKDIYHMMNTFEWK
jgi:gliding motility-associated lipoprotein GldD